MPRDLTQLGRDYGDFIIAKIQRLYLDDGESIAIEDLKASKFGMQARCWLSKTGSKAKAQRRPTYRHGAPLIEIGLHHGRTRRRRPRSKGLGSSWRAAQPRPMLGAKRKTYTQFELFRF
jgi:hypothetical protein